MSSYRTYIQYWYFIVIYMSPTRIPYVPAHVGHDDAL